MEYDKVVKDLKQSGAINMYTFYQNGYVIFLSTYQNHSGVDLLAVEDENEIVRVRNKTMGEVEEILERFTDGLPQHIRDKYFLTTAYDMGREHYNQH